MREIKFRIIHNNKVFGYEELCEDGWYWMCIKLNPDNGERWTPGVFALAPQYIRNQFTGLRDKNGKEIYEGDIMCFPEYENKKNKIRWVVSWDDEAAGWFKWSPKSEAEVIGNIYESPELLNP